MKFKMGESKFDVPQGTYRARFTGVEENEHPEFGPGYKWQFTLLDGVYAGKIASRSTSKEASLKNACGRMLNGLAGGTVQKDQEIDIQAFIGREYQIMVGPNSTGNGTRVETVMPLNGGHAPPAQHTTTTAAAYGVAAPVAVPVPPPPARPPARPAAPAASNLARLFWVETGAAEPQRMTGAEVESLMMATGSAEEAEKIPVMAEDQAGGWKTPSAFGLRYQTIPF